MNDADTSTSCDPRPAQRRARWPPACRSPGVLVEDLPESSGECFRLAGISELAAHEAAVMAGKHGRLLTKQFGGGHRRTSGEGAHGLLANAYHDACRRRGQRVEVRLIAADGPGPVGEQRVVPRAVILAWHPELSGIRCGLGEVVVSELSLPRGHCDEGRHAGTPTLGLVRVPKACLGALGSLRVPKYRDERWLMRQQGGHVVGVCRH